VSTNARRALGAALAVFGVILVIATNPRNSGAVCGSDRWAVKTLSDPRERNIDFLQMATGLERLRQLRRPRIRDGAGRMGPTETATYRVRVNLVATRLSPDRDVNLVVADPRRRAKTMRVGFPDVACRGAKGSREKSNMQRARVALVAKCGKPRSEWTRLRGTATIAGVAFFGDVQAFGAARNGIELHPVLDFTSHNCRRRRA
jgi:hypothetical protein